MHGAVVVMAKTLYSTVIYEASNVSQGLFYKMGAEDRERRGNMENDKISSRKRR